ncbi:MAG: hypothetical protein LBB29_03470 [Holosporaceae bacterium]|jgi:hypothetical protein|nr:hypothetical protein [Holosporaceae bacterium]
MDFADCTFDLIAAAGTIRRLKDDSLALILGKRIDGGSVSGTIAADKIFLDNTSISYGDSSIGMTNIDIPMDDFVASDDPYMNGVLRLTNISIREMGAILPENICRGITRLLKSCLPAFKLESFQIDLKGPLCLQENRSSKKLQMGAGVFTMKNAKIAVGNDFITNVNATGTVTNNNLEMKLSSAKMKNCRLNNGTFFVSHKDNFWKSEMNITTTKDEIFSGKNPPLHKNKIGKDARVEKNRMNKRKIPDASFAIACKSDCVRKIFSIIQRYASGNIELAISNSLDGQQELFKIEANLKNAEVSLPLLGVLKQSGEEGSFKTHISKINNDLEFTDLALSTANTQIAGKLSTDMHWNIKKCSFGKFDLNGCSARLSLQKKAANYFVLSILGDSLDACKFMPIIDILDKNISLSTYINLRELNISSYRKLSNVKGNLEISHNAIVGGTGMAVYRDDATLVLDIRAADKSSDCLVSLSASDAGEFMKYLGASDCLSGGMLNAVFKIPYGKIGKEPLSGGFEMTDFVFANCDSLNKLVSLSSPIVVPKDGITLGCNFFVGNVIISKDILAIRGGRMVSPTMAFTMDIDYERKKDNFTIRGLSLYLAALLTNQNSNGVFASEYKGSGSIHSPSIGVKAMKFITHDELEGMFGSMLPIPTPSTGNNEYVEYIEQNTTPLPRQNVKDPFASKAFDEEPANVRIMQVETNANPTIPENQKNNEKESKKHRIVDKKTGVIINRGANKHAAWRAAGGVYATLPAELYASCVCNTKQNRLGIIPDLVTNSPLPC